MVGVGQVPSDRAEKAGGKVKLRINQLGTGEYTVERSSGQTKWEPIDSHFYKDEGEAEKALVEWVLRKQKQTVIEVEEDDVLRNKGMDLRNSR